MNTSYSPSRDDAIVHCFTNGILTGTSLMVFTLANCTHCAR